MSIKNNIFDATDYLTNPRPGDKVRLIKGEPQFWNQRGLMDRYENTIQVVEKILEEPSGRRVFFKNEGEHDGGYYDELNSWYWRPTSNCMILVERHKTVIKLKFKL